jgi:hypothetical protein
MVVIDGRQQIAGRKNKKQETDAHDERLKVSGNPIQDGVALCRREYGIEQEEKSQDAQNHDGSQDPDGSSEAITSLFLEIRQQFLTHRFVLTGLLVKEIALMDVHGLGD